MFFYRGAIQTDADNATQSYIAMNKTVFESNTASYGGAITILMVAGPSSPVNALHGMGMGMPMRRLRTLHEAPVAKLDIAKNGPPALWLEEVGTALIVTHSSGMPNASHACAHIWSPR